MDSRPWRPAGTAKLPAILHLVRAERGWRGSPTTERRSSSRALQEHRHRRKDEGVAFNRGRAYGTSSTRRSANLCRDLRLLTFPLRAMGCRRRPSSEPITMVPPWGQAPRAAAARAALGTPLGTGTYFGTYFSGKHLATVASRQLPEPVMGTGTIFRHHFRHFRRRDAVGAGNRRGAVGGALGTGTSAGRWGQAPRRPLGTAAKGQARRVGRAIGDTGCQVPIPSPLP